MLVNLSLLKVKQDCAIDSHFKPPPKWSYCKIKLLPIFSTSMMNLQCIATLWVLNRFHLICLRKYEFAIPNISPIKNYDFFNKWRLRCMLCIMPCHVFSAVYCAGLARIVVSGSSVGRSSWHGRVDQREDTGSFFLFPQTTNMFFLNC